MKKDLKVEILDSFKKKHTVFAWVMQNDQVVRAELKFITVEIEKKKINLIPTPESQSYLEEMINGLGRINLIIPEKSLIFESEMLNFDENNNLSVSFPKYYRFYERRNFERIDPFIPIKVEFLTNNVKVLKDCFDISVGGFSLVFSKTESVPLNLGDEIKEVKVTRILDSHLSKALVVNVIKLKPFMLDNCPYGGTRVSFKFDRPSQKLVSAILEVINGQKKLLGDLTHN